MLAGRLILPSALAAKSKKKDSEKQAAITPTGRSDARARRTRSFAFDLRCWRAEIRIKRGFDPAIITGSAEIVRDFIGNSHEKSEEEAVVPRFRKVGKMVPLVDTCSRSIKPDRVTQSILQFAPGSRKDGDCWRRLPISIQSFVTMYRRMPAREDTDLFPMLRTLVSAHEYDAMAEDSEKVGTSAFWPGRLRKNGSTVANLEKAIGINDLAQFTPHKHGHS